MINCIALDDEPMALELIKSFCEKVPNIELTHCFTQPSQAKKYINKYPVDLLFLDIQMPDIKGIDFYKEINREIMVIFTTAYSEYAVEGFNVCAIDYLLKPIKFDRFCAACNKAIDYSNYLKSDVVTPEKFLFVRSEYALVKIAFDEIIYLETMDDYIRIHRWEGPPVLTLMSMLKILEKLPENEFVRVHRSFAVPISKIQSVKGKKIRINNKNIPIGSTYYKHFMDTFRTEKL